MFKVETTNNGATAFVRNKGGKVRTFKSRKQARRYCRNRQFDLCGVAAAIVHPSGQRGRDVNQTTERR